MRMRDSDAEAFSAFAARLCLLVWNKFLPFYNGKISFGNKRSKMRDVTD